jgi:L-fuculose-phosphate aldolase
VDDFARTRSELAAAARRLAARGLVSGTSGNAGARAGDLVAVTPTGAELADVSAEEIAVVDLDGNQVDGPLAPTSEVALHLALLRARGGGCVVHTHSPAATAIGCVVDELPLVHYDMLAFGGTVRVAPYLTFGTDELAAAVAQAIDGRNAALMRNHGAVCWGGDPASAATLAEKLEWVCDVYQRARAIGEPALLSDDDLAAVLEQVARRGYGRPRPVEEP